MEDIDKLLKIWFENKAEIKHLETRNEIIKKKLEKIMKEKSITHLTTNNYKVTKRTQETSRVLKNDLPSDLWEKYSTINRFSVVNIYKRK